jgi:hypothetical protein
VAIAKPRLRWEGIDHDSSGEALDQDALSLSQNRRFAACGGQGVAYDALPVTTNYAMTRKEDFWAPFEWGAVVAGSGDSRLWYFVET